MPQGQPYKYNGKELEKNFGLEMYEYGNRNYDPQLGRFPTIDRFTEKYYSLTPYQYGANNPVLYVDVNGDSILINNGGSSSALYHEGKLYNRDGTAYNGEGTTTDKDGNITLTKGFFKSTFDDLNKTRNGGEEGAALVNGLDKSDRVAILSTDGENVTEGATIYYNPNLTEGGPDENGNTYRPSFVGLGHEMGHVEDDLNGTIDLGTWFKDRSSGKYILNAEKYGVHVENKIRAENGLPLRAFFNTNPMTEKGQGRVLINGTRASNTFFNSIPNPSGGAPIQVPYIYSKQ